MSFDIWHQRLIYVGSNTIYLILLNKLVDSLNIYRELNIESLYENYIFGKYTAYPFNDTRQQKTYILEHIYQYLETSTSTVSWRCYLLYESNK